MRPDTGRVSIEDLRADGVLLEVNRRVLHPVGMSLTLETMDGPLQIHRQGTAAVSHYDPDMPGLAEKAAAFRAIEAAEHQARFSSLGYLIQPLPGEGPRVVQAFTADIDGIWAFIEQAAGEAAARVAHEPGETMAAAIASVLPSVVVAPLLGRLALVSSDGGATYEWRLQPEAKIDNDGSVWARGAYLSTEIERLQFGGAADVGDAGGEIREYVQRAKGELYEHEVEEFAAARVSFEQMMGRTVSEESAEAFAADLDEVHRTLERLYESAQPGMRVYRGDPDAREAFDQHRVRLKAAANSAVDRMDEYERLQAGELGDYEAADWQALDARLIAEIDEDARVCAEIEATLMQHIQRRDGRMRSLEVVRRALARGVGA